MVMTLQRPKQKKQLLKLGQVPGKSDACGKCTAQNQCLGQGPLAPKAEMQSTTPPSPLSLHFARAEQGAEMIDPALLPGIDTLCPHKTKWKGWVCFTMLK